MNARYARVSQISPPISDMKNPHPIRSRYPIFRTMLVFDCHHQDRLQSLKTVRRLMIHRLLPPARVRSPPSSSILRVHLQSPSPITHQDPSFDCPPRCQSRNRHALFVFVFDCMPCRQSQEASLRSPASCSSLICLLRVHLPSDLLSYSYSYT